MNIILNLLICSIVTFQQSDFYNKSDNLLNYIQLDTDISTEENIRHRARQAKTSGDFSLIQTDGYDVWIQGAKTPGLISFSRSLKVFFQAYQNTQIARPILTENLKNRGMSFVDIEKLFEIFDSSEPIDDFFERQTNMQRAHLLTKIVKRLENEKNTKANDYHKEVEKILMDLESYKEEIRREWAFEVINSFSHQGKLALASFCREKIIPSMGFTKIIGYSESQIQQATNILIQAYRSNPRLLEEMQK